MAATKTTSSDAKPTPRFGGIIPTFYNAGQISRMTVARLYVHMDTMRSVVAALRFAIEQRAEARCEGKTVVGLTHHDILLEGWADRFQQQYDACQAEIERRAAKHGYPL